MIISRTPVRISFVGGATDLRDFYRHKPGKVVSTAINKHIYVTVTRNFTDHIRVSYSQTEYVEKVDEIKHNLVREALRLVGIDKGVNIGYTSEELLPAHEGSGLGASSAILVGTLHALHAFRGEHVSAEQLAREACQIEIDILGNPIGKQDQYAAAYGGFNHIQFNPDESVYVNPVIISPEVKEKLNSRLLMFYTGINKRSDEILGEQKQKTSANLGELTRMADLTGNLMQVLTNGDLNGFGELLHENWMLKQGLASKITNSQINEYYNKARGAGAIGGKVLGSGGGGFLLFYCEEDKQDDVRKALKDLRELKFKFENQGSRIIYVGD